LASVVNVGHYCNDSLPLHPFLPLPLLSLSFFMSFVVNKMEFGKWKTFQRGSSVTRFLKPDHSIVTHDCPAVELNFISNDVFRVALTLVSKDVVEFVIEKVLRVLGFQKLFLNLIPS
jgi:hypothetical protein